MVKYSFGYWVFGKDMLKVDLSSLHKHGVTDLFLNFYAFTTHGESKVLSWIKKADSYDIRVHIWVQSFYDGDWVNPKTADLTGKLKEIKKYANLDGVGGVHLDYLRYPGNAYKTSGGADAITGFVKKVRSQNPKVFLSCAVMPEESAKYYYGQDIAALGKVVDAILPMQYKGNYNAGTSWLASTTKSFSSKAVIWSGLQSYKSDDDPTKLSGKDLLSDAKTCIGSGAKGVVLFRYGLSVDVDFTSLTGSDSKKTTSSTSSSKNKNVVSGTEIKQLAVAVKEYVESNRKFTSKIKVNGRTYTYGQMAYLLSFAVNNPGKSLELFSVANAANVVGDKVKVNLYEDDFKDLSKRVYNYILDKKQCPNYASVKSSGKRLRPRVFIYMLARIVVYYYNHGKALPRYASVDTGYFK